MAPFPIDLAIPLVFVLVSGWRVYLTRSLKGACTLIEEYLVSEADKAFLALSEAGNDSDLQFQRRVREYYGVKPSEAARKAEEWNSMFDERVSERKVLQVKRLSSDVDFDSLSFD